MSKQKTYTTDEVQAAEGEMAGWCTTCQEFVNHGDVEPDAENYQCETCGENTVRGVGNALLDNLLPIAD